MINSVIRHREFKGPTPYGVSILARPTNKRPAEHLILERRRIEDLREKSIAVSNYNKQCDLRSAWVLATDKNIEKNCVAREMTKHIQAEDICLEKRREELREMLLVEEDDYIREMESMEETIEDRQEKMKERAKYLKEKRESERLAYVSEKLDDKFREECEELRPVFSKRLRDDIFNDRQMQIQMKQEQAQRDKEMETFYANLWETDTKAKEIREEQETKERLERDREALEVLNLQKRALENMREEEHSVKKMEAEWLKEEASLRAYEEEQLLKEKMEKQKNQRRARDISLKLKNRKEAREKQEELAIDMKILDKILRDTENEATEDSNRKIQMHDEMQRFMHYVSKTRKEDEEQEIKLEKLIDKEVQGKWREKDARIALEKKARKTLMEDVLKTREQQIKEREKAMREEQEAALRERHELHEQMEAFRQLENEKICKIRKENEKYQNDLEQQIEYQRKLKEKEIDIARRELGSLTEAEETYQRRLRSALHQTSKKLHPLRIHGQSSHLANRLETS